MRGVDEKYAKASWFVFGGRVKRAVKGFEIDYFKVGNKNTTIGLDTVANKNRTGCDCGFEGIHGAKKELACSHLVASVLYRCLKPLMDSGEIKIMVRGFDNDYKELKLKDEKE